MLEISAPQNIFLNGLNTKYRAYVGGFGSGKTFVGCIDLLLFFAEHPGVTQGYFGISYPAIRDIFYPTFTEAAELLGFIADVKYGNKEAHIYRNGRYYGTVICRSMDNPSSIVGFKIARALVDEIDVLPKDKATLAWNKIIARLRLKIDGIENSIGITTTPEGFFFVYEHFKKDPSASYSMVQASSYENEKYLPDDYIDSLLETYPSELVKAYVNGEFVNLKSGTVYNNYDRKLNNTKETWDGKEPIYIGMDFNVGKMAGIVHVKREGKPIAVDEIINAYDTPEMIRVIKERYRDVTIRVYPDASGQSRKSVNASKTDLSLITSEGLSVIANKSNPFVKDRVLAMNQNFCDNKGYRNYLVNADKCPTYADNLEQQSWTEAGEPDKKHDNDHTNDAGGYFISYDYPVIKPVTKLVTKFAR
ncbi:MAG: terminase [Gammaproteobacteria bacterium]|nr:terminase [Gammaproteobacteria bacterium]